MSRKHKTERSEVAKRELLHEDTDKSPTDFASAAHRSLSSQPAARISAQPRNGERPSLQRSSLRRKRTRRCRRWSKKAVIDAIQKRHRNGKSLDRTYMEDPALYQASSKYYGNWTLARAEAGLPVAVRDYYSPDEVRIKIIELYERQLPLTISAQKDLKLKPSARKHFGGWRRAVISLGLGSELRREWTEQAVIDAISNRMASGLDLARTRFEDTGLFGAAVKIFGNWTNALLAAGLERQRCERWNKEKIIHRLRLYAQATLKDAELEHVSNSGLKALEHSDPPGNDLESTNIFPRDVSVVRGQDEADGDGECLVFDKREINVLRQAAARYFGSWAKAIYEAGIADGVISRRPQKKLTSDDVVSIIQKAYADGRSHRAILREEIGLKEAVRTYFGKWRIAVDAAGLTAKKRTWTRELIIAEIRQRSENGLSLSSRTQGNAVLAFAARYYFGNWSNALQAAGISTTPRKPRCSNDS